MVRSKIFGMVLFALFLTADCRSVLPAVSPPNTSGESPSPSVSASADPAGFTACVRAHGMPEFPDLDEFGGFDLGPGSGVDPGTPEYHDAYEACQNNV
ncbi:hypothetical protein I0C86_10935 [Plantactinospora sp. S1510]|uniref:Lipoprotein n=2 Tax=Plantactinospora alkalitolerans TaxID=2789879 RepID=A0ABS0GTV4_9ACTN|nr:hypothetical protein [Plantactinospora alkalitolerans]